MAITSHLLGIDLGGTKIEIVALDNTGDIHYRHRTATPKHNNPNEQYNLIIRTIEQLVIECEQQLNEKALPLGIGIPGAISPKSGLIKNANTTCLIGKDFKNDLVDRLSRKVLLENDANCFALSEAVDGAGKDSLSVFGVILGTGVGGGIVYNKQLLIGANAIGGEWGHNPLPWPTKYDDPTQACYCGKQGCIETYLSGPGMSRQNKLQFDLTLSSRELLIQRHTNKTADQAYERYVDRLARSLASVINILDPDSIVLGGGLSNIDSLYEDVPKVWEKYAFSDGLTTKLIKNVFGDSSGVRGAAWLNLEKA